MPKPECVTDLMAGNRPLIAVRRILRSTPVEVVSEDLRLAPTRAGKWQSEPPKTVGGAIDSHAVDAHHDLVGP